MRSEAMFADTIAEYYVEDDHIRLELEIGANDVAVFRNLLPDALYQRLGLGETPLAERLPKFAAEDMPVFVGERRLVGQIANISPATRPLLDESPLHQHGPEGEHSHQGTAFTTWLDPELAILQAESITDALIEIAPSGETGFRENMASLRKDLVQLDLDFAEVFSQLEGRPVLFSHPVYQYLQHRYEINGQSLHWEPDEAPSIPAWIRLQQMRASHSALIMIWEDQPLTSTATRLSDTGISSVSFQLLANRPDQGDFLSAMHANGKRLNDLLSSD